MLLRKLCDLRVHPGKPSHLSVNSSHSLPCGYTGTRGWDICLPPFLRFAGRDPWGNGVAGGDIPGRTQHIAGIASRRQGNSCSAQRTCEADWTFFRAGPGIGN